MLDIADRKSAELEAALWKASEEGKYPVLCAQSPCLHRMKKVMHQMKLYEPAEFIMKYLVPRLDFHPIDRPIALHITCSTRQMGVADDLIHKVMLLIALLRLSHRLVDTAGEVYDLQRILLRRLVVRQ